LPFHVKPSRSRQRSTGPPSGVPPARHGVSPFKTSSIADLLLRASSPALETSWRSRAPGSGLRAPGSGLRAPGSGLRAPMMHCAPHRVAGHGSGQHCEPAARLSSAIRPRRKQACVTGLPGEADSSRREAAPGAKGDLHRPIGRRTAGVRTPFAGLKLGPGPSAPRPPSAPEFSATVSRETTRAISAGRVDAQERD